MWCVELVSPHLQYMCSPWSMLAYTCLSMHVRTDAQYSTNTNDAHTVRIFITH